MRISELDYSLLTDEDKYNLIMSGIKDFGKENATDETKADAIVVLGCSPRPLKARVKKMMELHKKGYSDVIILSGGRGWQKLVRQNPSRKPELVQAIKDVITKELLGENVTQVEMDSYRKFNEKMKELIGKKYKEKTYQEALDEGKMEMTEDEFMQLIVLSNGGLTTANIFHEPMSTNTKENSLYISRIMQTLKQNRDIDIKSVMVVTSAYHCTRSKLNFMHRYPDKTISVCPSTEDLEENGIHSFEEMMSNKKYHDAIVGEAQKIITYSRKGDIKDVELTELVSPEIAKNIEQRQREAEAR
jgi:uncharacterized SAM-binding protein YcdF (DUF218 family)